MMSALITPDIAKKESLDFFLVKQSSTIQPWKVDLLGPDFWTFFPENSGRSVALQ